jgi:GH15 family glucan-1,4-alpha-glucosidase
MGWRWVCCSNRSDVTQPRTPPPIEDYGLIGDTRTAALAASDGSIDWLCLPRFDGEPVFARLVAGSDGGHFSITPREESMVVARRYRPHCATLETTWSIDTGVTVTLAEAMIANVAGTGLSATLLVRRIAAEGGSAEVVIEFSPRFGEQRIKPKSERRGSVLVCSHASTALAVCSSPPIDLRPDQPANVTVEPDRPLIVAVSAAHREPLYYPDPEVAWSGLRADEEAWQDWCKEIDEDLPHREAVLRSLLTLALLTYSPSGAPVAAPTTSLPEDPGGVRNWDYRYAWPRDASIGVGAFLGVGKVAEARRFLGWLLHASRLDRPRLPVLFTLHGRHPPPERELDCWPGYADSVPVRVGNGAATQHQLDGYGWVLDAAWLLTDAGQRLYSETWRAMRGFADQVAKRWAEPDAGIWEIRGDGAQHVHSKLMAWLTLDRALRIAATRRTRRRDIERWETARDAVARQIQTCGFNPDLGTYTRSYGSDDLDAAILILPLLKIEPRDSERVAGTVDAISQHLSAGGPLLYRYPPGEDGLQGGEGAFLPCSFWLVQALASTGRPQPATSRMDQLVKLSSPLGLFGEEMDPRTGAHLGNYPQALTHAALIQAALAIRRANQEWPRDEPAASNPLSYGHLDPRLSPDGW